MKFVFACLAAFAGLVYWMLFASTEAVDTQIAHVALDALPASAESVPQATARFDPEVSSDGAGSVRIDAEGPTFVELAEVEGAGEDLSFRQLVFQAQVKTEAMTGPVFLVMQAGIHEVPMPVVGADQQTLTGTQDWTPMEVVAGNPQDTFHRETTTLQLEVRGAGTVWIDDLRLVNRKHL